MKFKKKLKRGFGILIVFVFFLNEKFEFLGEKIGKF
jgi:hypothetical protein